MLKGDLSNDLAQGIGVRFERVVKTDAGKLNRNAKATLLGWSRDLDANLYIVTTEDERKAAAFCLKWGVPYHRVIPVDSLLEIPQVCIEMDLLRYYDLDMRVLQNVNSRGHGKIKAEQWQTVES